MAASVDLLDRDQLISDAIAFGVDAVRADATANVLDRMEHGDGTARRAEAERLRRARDLCTLLGGFDGAVLTALADGSIHAMLQEARAASRRRKAIGGGR